MPKDIASLPQAAFAALRRTLAALLLVALAAPAFGQGAVVSQSLQDEVAGLLPLQTTTVIVTFDQMEPITAAQRAVLAGLGITRGITFESLPIAAVLATPAQVSQLAGLDGVRSLWANEQLTYYNEGGTAVTGVDRLREDPDLRTALGTPYSGRGVTAVVIDSGIDATHADLEYGTHVVENVQAATNLNAISGLLPITYLEGQPNTDTNSGHGTHCAATLGGTGARSGGLYEGVAPGADLIGYGSGAVIAILDVIGGFDYALTHQFSFEHPIRITSNSYGPLGGGEFDPADPLTTATYVTYKRGITNVFAAGNDGSGEDTHSPYGQAPWVISVGAGTKAGNLADFSSRGVKGQEATFTMPDGQVWTTRNEITVTAPGVDIISARSATNLGANGGEGDVDAIPPAYLPFYTQISGTSMATPHVAGIVALMLEADPTLSPLEVKEILSATATNMPGRETWEAGTGYVNAYAAVAATLGDARYTGDVLNSRFDFNASANISVAGEEPFSIEFNPVGETEEIAFEVADGIALVSARAVVDDNTVALVLLDPAGNRYGSSISIPVLGSNISVSAPGRPGTWTLTVRGIGSISGIPTDPLGLTNGTSLPGTVEGLLKFLQTDGFTGLDDVDPDSPAAPFIQYAVSKRLVDAKRNGFRPNAHLRRGEMAQYLVMGAGVRQFFPADGSDTFSDVSGLDAAFAEAVSAQGAALKNGPQNEAGLMVVDGDAFRSNDRLDRVDLAYAFVQGLGLEAFVDAYADEMTVAYEGQRVPIADADAIPAGLRGYAQIALELGILNARFALEQGPYDLTPTLRAYFDPFEGVDRADYAVTASRYFDSYFNGFELPEAQGRSAGTATSTSTSARGAGTPGAFEVAANYPNPFAASTTIAYMLSESGEVSVTVYNVTGQRVAVLAHGVQEAGVHEVEWDASGLASGVYLYRVQSGSQVETRRMTLMR